MINFMYDSINRFLNYRSRPNEESLDRCFGTPRWRDIRESPDREAAMLDLYKEQVRATGRFQYVTSTRILKPLQDRAYFHLVYATRHPKGILKFREVEKKVVTAQEEVRASAQRVDREQRTSQTVMDFSSTAYSPALLDDRSEQLRKGEAKLMELVRGGRICYEILQPIILELPLVWNADLNRILVECQ